ncbi:hypothetical protein HC723_08540 [Vibrio sp. S11_S32]|uniref:hypothetical protein n=1 Tax=Vibrio sp. S11_S32 TaxID=2720225 RepID=UPI0016801C70|nr:hypothetical protein [Vibrio sp. S11_S32]MBD1576484.1 hypothetical protein [Vibrio sp. S11_S32]
MNFEPIDIPFNYRHTCWFCGEPAADMLDIPLAMRNVKLCTHQPISVPICAECQTFPVQQHCNSIWQHRDYIKQRLMKVYAKHLGIGLNWTKQELEEASFEGSIFEGFSRSAWAMYQIANERVRYAGWDLTVAGSAIGYDDSAGFEFDGVRFASQEACMNYYCAAQGLNTTLFEGVLNVVGYQRFSYALKISQINRKARHYEIIKIIDEIEQQELDTQQIHADNSVKENQYQLVAIDMGEAVAEPQAIEWALDNDIETLEQLEQAEDEFFDAFAHLGGVQAFQLFNGLQLYLAARADDKWIAQFDLNREAWM